MLGEYPDMRICVTLGADYVIHGVYLIFDDKGGVHRTFNFHLEPCAGDNQYAITHIDDGIHDAQLGSYKESGYKRSIDCVVTGGDCEYNGRKVSQDEIISRLFGLVRREMWVKERD